MIGRLRNNGSPTGSRYVIRKPQNLEGDSKSKTSFSAVEFFFLPQKYINHKNNKTTRFELCLIPHGNFPTLLKSDYCCCCKSAVGKHYISLFEEKSVEYGLVEAIQNYGNIKLWKKRTFVSFPQKKLSIVLLAQWHSHCILNDGMNAETLKIHSPKASKVSSSLALTASQ